MKKRLFCLLLFAALLSALFWLPAAADTGPKPSVTVAFPGLEGEYYATLLSKYSATGPYRSDGDFLDELEAKTVGDAEKNAAFRAFREHADPDGYYFVGFIQKVSADDDLFWGYFPPSDFKVLLYGCGTGALLSGEPQSRYAFASRFEVRLTAAEGKTTVETQKGYDYSGEGLRFLLRLAVTFAVEMLLALAFDMLRCGRWRTVLLANFVTQILLNAALQLTTYLRGVSLRLLPLSYFLLEVAVLAAEAAVYAFCFARKTVPEEQRLSVRRCILYALAGNVASFAAGVALWLVMK